MSLSSAKAKLDAQGGDPVTGYISKTDHQESYDELVDDTALTGATTAEALDVTGALTAGTITSDATVAGTGLAGGLLSSANPVINGVAAPGTSAIPSRQDHVHASDTTKVTGPASATDNALMRFDGAGGKTAQNSGITVDDSGNVTSDLVVSKANAAVQMNATSGAADFYLDTTAGNAASIRFRAGTSLRWIVTKDSSAESSTATGSDLYVSGYNNSGSLIGAYLQVQRSTGRFTIYNTGAGAGLRLGSGGPEILSGTGSPEGVVSAPINSVWNRSDGDALGDFVYHKRAGTGNTGWVVSEGDTGQRDMSAEALSNSWTLGSSVFRIRRIGAMVALTIGANKTSASSDDIYTLPVGFRPVSTVYGVSSSATDDYGHAAVTNGGVIAFNRTYMTAATHYVSMTWQTSNAWPATLPGTA